jgi:transposase
MASEKKITREHKKTLSKEQKKEFRSLMWEFRRDKKKLTAKEQQKLEKLFEQLPELKTLYDMRVRFKEIFDSDLTKRQARGRLTELFLDATAAFPALDTCYRTFEEHQEKILAYFDKRQTSGVVEGINNKARVITKRCYGLKSADSLWTRLILDLNRAGKIVQHTIKSIRVLVQGLRPIFA